MRTAPGHMHRNERQPAILVGVDIGGTNTMVGVMDAAGTVLRQSAFPTNPSLGSSAFVERLAQEIISLLPEAGDATTLSAIGLACPAVNAREGIVDNPANLGWGRVDLAGLVRQHFDVPIALLNDGDAAAFGELTFGVARGLHNVVMLTLGTGLGGGIVVNGELVRGSNGTGGEIGHIIVVPGGRLCNCGRRGCAETYISATGVCRTAAELLGIQTIDSALRDLSFREMTAAAIFELAAKGDPLARMTYDQTGESLGTLLANLAAVFDPDAFVLYGGLVHAGDLLLSPTIRAFRSNVLDRYRNTVKILVSDLNDGRAPILGAGIFAHRSVAAGQHHTTSVFQGGTHE